MKQVIISLIIIAIALAILVALGKPADAASVRIAQGSDCVRVWHFVYVNNVPAYGIGNIVWQNRETGQVWQVHHTGGSLMCLPRGWYNYVTWIDANPAVRYECREPGCVVRGINITDEGMTGAGYYTYWDAYPIPVPTATPTVFVTPTVTPTPRR